MSSGPERPTPDEREPPFGRDRAPDLSPPDLRCRRCQKRIRDLEMELYFLQTGLCYWCAYIDPQG